METEKLLNTKEAAGIIGANHRTLDNWRNLGRGPVYVKLNARNVKYSMADLLDYIARHRVNPGGGHESPGQSIRKHCLECCGSAAEVKNCCGDKLLDGTTCPLFPYRMGRGRPSVKIIRRECKACMNGSLELIRNCQSVNCHLHAFRFGRNPNVKTRPKQAAERGLRGQFVENSRRSFPGKDVTA